MRRVRSTTRSFRSLPCLGLVLVLWSAIGSLPSAAQTTATSEAAPATEEAPVPPGVFAPSEVAQGSEDLKAVLRRAIELATPETAIAKIEARLPTVDEDVSRGIEEAKGTLATPSSLAELAELERGLLARSSELAGWRTTLTRRSKGIEELLEELDRYQDRWSRTRDELREDAPRELLAAINANLAALAQGRKVVSERRRTLLAMLSAVSTLELSARDMIEEIVDARVGVRAALFQPDQRDLVGALRGESSIATAPRRIADVVLRDVRIVRDYVEPRLGSLPWLAVAFVLSLALARALRDRIRSRRRADEPISGPVEVFERPFSIALFGTFVAASIIYPFAPNPAIRLAELLVLVPAIRLLQPTLAPHFRPLLYAVACLFLIDRFRDAVSDVLLLERLVLFAETCGATILLFILLRPGRLARLPAEDLPPAWLGGMLRGGMLALGTSAVVNVFGFVTLARLLADGTLSAAYAGFLIFAAYRLATTGLLVSMTNPAVAKLGVVRNGSQGILLWAHRLLRPAAFVGWLWFVLDGFAIRDWFTRGLVRALSTPLEVGTVSISLGNLLSLAAAIFAAVYASRFIRFVLEEDVYRFLPLRRGVGAAISASVHYALMIVGFLLALGFAGLDLTKFTILAGALGVGIGFGLQNIVNNFISGLILLYERPIQVGDVVEVSGELSTVERIGIRSSTVRTVRGAELIVPNGNLISQELKNWTLTDGRRRVDIPVGVAYGSDHGEVLDVLIGCLESVERIHLEPRPVVLFRGLGDSSLDFEVRFWANAEDFPRIESEAVGAIYARLAEAGIQIPFPQRDVHVRSTPSGSG